MAGLKDVLGGVADFAKVVVEPISNVFIAKENTKQKEIEEKRKEKESNDRKELEKELERQKSIQKAYETQENIAINASDNMSDVTRESLNNNKEIVNNVSDNMSDTAKEALNSNKEVVNNVSNNMSNVTKESLNNNKEVLNKVVESYDSHLKKLSDKHKELLNDKTILEEQNAQYRVKESLLLLLNKEKDNLALSESLRREVENEQKEYFLLENENSFYKGKIEKQKEFLKEYNNDFFNQLGIIKRLKAENIAVKLEIEKLKDIEKKIIDVEFELLSIEKERIIKQKKKFDKKKTLMDSKKNYLSYVENMNNEQQIKIEKLLNYQPISPSKKIEGNDNIIDIDIDDN